MSSKIKYFLILLGVFVLGFSFSIFTLGLVSAEPMDRAMKPLLVEIMNLPLAITGAVNVDNLPLDEASGSLRTVSPEVNLRDGRGTIYFSGSNRSISVPEGVVMTDAWIRRWNSSTDDPCWIYFYNIEDGAFDANMSLFPSSADPTVELHFESGVASTPEREIGFFMNADCTADVFWTGYE